METNYQEYHHRREKKEPCQLGEGGGDGEIEGREKRGENGTGVRVGAGEPKEIFSGV